MSTMMRPEVTDDESLQSWDYRRVDEQFLTTSCPPLVQDSAVSSIDNGSAATTATESVDGAPTQRPDDNPESDGGCLDGTAINSSVPERPSGPHKCNRRNPNTAERCKKTFSRQADLRRHEKTHDGATKTLRCGSCSKKFTRRDALLRHYGTFHSDTECPDRKRGRGGHSGKAALARRESDKKRRDKMDNAMRELLEQLPDQGRPGERISKPSVIERALDYIKTLKEENTKLLRVAE